VEFGLTKAAFLRISPAELSGMMEQASLRERRRFAGSAMICSIIANVHRDPEKKSEPWTPDDFMPGAEVKTKEEEMIEWLEALERGEAEDDPEAVERFKQQMKATFRMMEKKEP